MIIKSRFFETLIFFIIGLTLIIFSPNFFLLIEPDSQSYIDNSAFRKSFFPMIIDIFESFGDKNYSGIVLFQQLALTTSIVFFLSTLNSSYFKLGERIVVFLLIFLNIYYISFSKTILTESLFFTFINLILGFLIIIKEYNNKILIGLGLCIGILFAIKSIGVVLSVSFLLITLISINLSKKNILIFISALIIFPTIEFFYYTKTVKGTSNDSVIYQSMLGKIFMISGSKNFDKNLFLKNNQTFISLLSDNSKPINKFLYNIKNPYLFLDLHADFEVVGQYQILNIDEESKKIIKQIFPKIIKKYPLEYIKISLFNYLGLWSPGGKKIFLNEYIQDNKIENIPLKSKLQMVSGEILEISKIILLVSLLFFSLLFLLFTIFSITTFLNVFKKKKITD